MGRQEFQKFCLLYLVLYLILRYSLRFSRFPSSLPFRTPTCCSFLPLPPFPLGSQPPVFPHLLILLVLKNTRHKYDNNIFPSSVAIFQLLSVHWPPQPPGAMHVHCSTPRRAQHSVTCSASLLRGLCGGSINDTHNSICYCKCTTYSCRCPCLDHKKGLFLVPKRFLYWCHKQLPISDCPDWEDFNISGHLWWEAAV